MLAKKPTIIDLSKIFDIDRKQTLAITSSKATKRFANL